jgi:hypothetical protein
MKRTIYLAIILLLLSLSAYSQKIALDPSMLSYYQGQGNQYISLSKLVDEQALISSPLSDNSASPKPVNIYKPTWGTVPKIQIDLGATFTLSQVALWDSWNAVPLSIKYDNNGTWTEVANWNMSYSQKWKAFTVNVTTSKLLIEFSGLNGHMGEIALFGTSDGGSDEGDGTDDGGGSDEGDGNDEGDGTDDGGGNDDGGGAEGCTPAKLALSPGMVTKESGGGDAGFLVNEQSIAGDPANGTGGTPSQTWFPGWSSSDATVSAYVNLGSPKKISAIYLKDVENTGGFTVSAGSPGNWSPLFTDKLTGYQSWNAHEVDVTTQYLRFTRETSGSNVSEVVIYGCEGTTEPDTQAPAAITNLSKTTVTSNSVKLNWTAPGDDGNTGTASAYDIRYSTSVITAANFNAATQLSGAPAPATAATSQSFVVTGLTANTAYHFAIKASDEVPHTSPISNVISATTSAANAPEASIPMDKFMGANSFVDDPVDKMQAVGIIREYHPWNWDEAGTWNDGKLNYPGYPNNEIKWAPSYAGGGWWNFDDFYTKVTNAGLLISPVITRTVKWLHGGNNFPAHDKPVDEPGASTTNPHSYEKKAHHMYQYAARYGSTAVPLDKLTLAPGQPKNTGMNLLKYIEDWNEQDKTWEGAAAQFSPQEYAAMASANYDGHARTMTQGSGTFGVKNADPDIKLVMGGISKLKLDYIKQMKAWFEANRPDGKFAADVINVHHYSWSGKGPSGGGPALSPEADNFRGRMEEFVNYRNEHLPGLEVWISEFGWDTNPDSPLRVPQISGNDMQETQGQWLVRAYLAFAAAGVDRAQMYMLRDEFEPGHPNISIQFATSGLIGHKGDWTPKKSWYYVYTLKNTLTNMVYIGEQASSDPNVLIYKFKDVNSNKGAYVAWAKTSSGYQKQDLHINVPGATSATLIKMTPGDTDGVSSTLSVSGGKVSVDVSERPVFINVNSIQ